MCQGKPNLKKGASFAPEAIRPRARLPGRHASRRPRPRLPSGDACRLGRRPGLPCPWCGWPKKESPWTDATASGGCHGLRIEPWRTQGKRSPMTPTCRLATTLRPPTPSGWGRRCVPVGCGTARAGPPIDSGRGPVRIGAAAKARAVDMPVEMPSRRSWLAARAVTACLGTCVLPAPACGHLHSARLETRTKESDMIAGAPGASFYRDGAAASLSRATESRAPVGHFGKQNWRCGMNRKPGYGAKLRANLEPTKGVGRLRQQDGGHGSRNPLRSV
ncbi:hypothetical protein L6452_47027 [Arctium lappa]|nr:hypothetical protein L6452_47027 [Arctium lappa]